MEHLGALSYFNLLVLISLFSETSSSNAAVSFTAKDSYLASHVMKTVFSNDWLSCTLACQDDDMCVSYNYNTFTGSCDLNEQGIQQPFSGPGELVKMQGMIFHQIRVSARFFLFWINSSWSLVLIKELIFANYLNFLPIFFFYSKTDYFLTVCYVEAGFFNCPFFVNSVFYEYSFVLENVVPESNCSEAEIPENSHLSWLFLAL